MLFASTARATSGSRTSPTRPGMPWGDNPVPGWVSYTREDLTAVLDSMGRGLDKTDGGWIDTIEFQHVRRALHELRNGPRIKVLVRTQPSART